jgi:hypothetical protein
MGKFIDLTGEKFGDLTVIEKAESTNNGVKWLCKCNCGNYKKVLSSSLRSDITKTCGECLNRYEFKNDYVIGYTKKGNKFYIDLDDYEKIKHMSWTDDSNGYIINRKNNILLHRFIMKPSDDMEVDHIYGKRNDNRKSQLRVCTHQQNLMNQSNRKGYSWNKKLSKYQAYIMKDYKRIHLGYYNTQEEARQVYLNKAEELFGEFSPRKEKNTNKEE